MAGINHYHVVALLEFTQSILQVCLKTWYSRVMVLFQNEFVTD